MPKKKKRIYAVSYTVTREETYLIEARSAKEATENAFSDGECRETGETYGVVHNETTVQK